MQYLHLVYLAEQQRRALAGRDAVATWNRFPAPDTAAVERRSPQLQDDDCSFFTDGPFIETKEYLAGGKLEQLTLPL